VMHNEIYLRLQLNLDLSYHIQLMILFGSFYECYNTIILSM